MRQIQPFASLLCVLLTVSPLAAADNAGAPLPQTRPSVDQITFPSGRFSRITGDYRPREVAPINLGNSNRLDSLLRAGNIYLSLQDVIALALENNIDIETQRYGAMISDVNIGRAQAGGALRGVTPQVQNGPTSAQPGQSTGVTQSAAAQASSASNTSGALVQQTGSLIPNLDPSIQGLLRFGHTSQPQSSQFVTGTSALVLSSDVGNLTYNQGFLTGTTFSLGYADFRQQTNSNRADFNPSRTGSFTLNVTQHLLQGYGIAVNNRNIRIAKNQRESADLQFKEQVITTVSTAMNLYWDLVSFNDDVKAKQQSLAYNQKLYDDNRKQVEIGTLAPIEIVRAEAAVAGSQQDLILSQTRVLQQETTLKSYLSKTGVASPALIDAHVIPTDRIRIPDVEPIEPYQDMVAMALRSRPELSQSRISVTNAKINLKGSRSQLLPTLDAFAIVANNGLIGTVNAIPVPPGSSMLTMPGDIAGGTPVLARSVNTFFLGGYGNLFSQLFNRNFPDYSAGVQLNIPLRNRAAQSDYILDQITVRQGELALQKQENTVRVEVQNAIIGLQQARAVYQSSVKARVLQEQTLDAEQKKLALGASTIFNVILVQRDLAGAQSAEVTALSNYSKARVEIERATGQTLINHNISVEEAFKGTVSRPASPLPVLP
ncbi:MAG: TolC family protein [Acidobacteriota bacterium]|nr:TolC family protein [Acidobacteriota bacterium]